MSSSENEKEKPGIRIVDRRRFDSSGEEKSEQPPERTPATVNSSPPPSAAPILDQPGAMQPASAGIEDGSDLENSGSGRKMSEADIAKQVETVREAYDAATGKGANSGEFTMSDSEADDGNESEISFGSFVLSLATQALMQLGQLKAPDGMAIAVDPGAAKQTIDILGVLQAKTKGNLDAREEGLLRDALHSLRLAFLRFR
jgi:Domain of unknown function (DUF1844)